MGEDGRTRIARGAPGVRWAPGRRRARAASLEGWLADLPAGAKCSLILTGDEMLRGDRADTLGPALARRLRCGGMRPGEFRIVGDEVAEIRRAVREACARSRVVIVTGGLGATGDDTTRHALASLTRRPLVTDRIHAREVRKRLDGRGRFAGPPATRRRAALAQSRLPRGALALGNPLGLALAFVLRRGGEIVIALPGVPAEAIRILETSILPALAARSAPGRGAAASADLHVFGISETEAERRVRRVLRGERGVDVGFLAGRGGVVVHLESRGAVRLARILPRCRRALGRAWFGEGDVTLEGVVGNLLLERGLTVALAESCTGGLVGAMLTRVAGISGSLLEGWVCYTNAAKHARLGVPLGMLRSHGAVSRQVAAAMARGARKRSGADLAAAVTGIAGPGGGSSVRPVGLVWHAVASHRGVRVLRCVFPGPRQVVRRRAAATALDLLRREILASPRGAGRGAAARHARRAVGRGSAAAD